MTDDAPLTFEQAEALVDQALRELENETAEEAEKRDREYEKLLKDDPEFAAAMDGLREIFEKGGAGVSRIIDNVKEWRIDQPPTPANAYQFALLEYFFQRGATVSYTSTEGQTIERCLKGPVNNSV